MKKIIIAGCLAASMLISSSTFAFADSTMNFTGTTVSLSLEEAINTMQTSGTKAEAANISLKSDEAIASGYTEQARSIRGTLQSLGMVDDLGILSSIQSSGITSTNLKVVRLQRDFAQENKERNYKADMNAIEKETIQVYYGVLLAEENLKINQDNLAVQKTILSNVQAKYNAGTAAQIDVTTQEAEVFSAETDVENAYTALNSAKMNFNYLIGYDLNQSVNFTEELKQLDRPAGTLNADIQKALENRIEIKGAYLIRDIQEALIENLTLIYPMSSPTYKSQQVATLEAQKLAADMPKQIEMDIRIKYMGLNDGEKAIDNAKTMLNTAKEAYRIAEISYEAGISTLVEVQEAQVRVYQANLNLANKINEYDLAVYDYIHALDVGTTRIALQ